MRYVIFLILTAGLTVSTSAAESTIDYSQHIAPLLKKYCIGCHNPDDRNGDLSLESFADLQQGGESGVAVLAGEATSSRLIRVLTGKSEPKMPPDDEPSPTADELTMLIEWVDAGATGPNGAEPDRTTLIVPKIAAASVPKPITALAISPDDSVIAIGRFATVELQDAATGKTIRRLPNHPGKVNRIEFTPDGSRLVTASGIAGLFGKATIWDVADGKQVTEFVAHRDTLYDATLSPNGKYLATAGYDRKIMLWDVDSGKVLRELTGHNGAIYDLAFNPDSTVLASASADETIKLWHVESGDRLDTLGQPLDEQYVVTFSPDGRFIVGGGADNRIRVWRFVSKNKPRINPLVYARFAHEGPVIQLAFSSDGKSLVSVGEDRAVKIWETRTYAEVALLENQPDDCQAMTMSATANEFWVGRMDGSLQTYSIPAAKETANVPAVNSAVVDMDDTVELANNDEHEPNDVPESAMSVVLPGTVNGVIDGDGDVDLYRFDATEGQQWMLEVNAARQKSPLDSKVEVLDADGQSIMRVILQAVRDSYFTFRGKDSSTIDDFRVHNWREMELNQYLYANGEVVKLWLYPRGPDSGFKVYPGSGKRYTYFDTTPLAHALQAPCYIVEPHPPGTTLIPNGLPVFPIYYVNDDDSRRKWGSDSRLSFTAPSDGQYLVRVTDARGFGGEGYKYSLTVRPRKPDFHVTLHGANPSVAAGSGKEFEVRVDRIDGFEGPIQVNIDGVPDGFHITSPVIIQAGQDNAYGVINADANAPEPAPENAKKTKVTATAMIHGQPITHDVNGLGEIKLAGPPKVSVRLLSADGSQTSDGSGEPMTLEIAPGETVMARVRLERNGFTGNVSFGKEDSGRNLPHGVFVDNIGLNGLLILSGQDERDIFITAAPWVQEQTRSFHLVGRVEGNQASWPVILQVKQKR